MSFSRAVSRSLWPVTLMKIEEYYVGRCCTTLDIFFFFHIQERCSLPRSLHKRRRSTLKPFFECKKLSKKKNDNKQLDIFFFLFSKDDRVCKHSRVRVCVLFLIITTRELKFIYFIHRSFFYSNEFQLLGQLVLKIHLFPPSFFFSFSIIILRFHLFVSFPRLVCLFVVVVFFLFIVQHLIRSAWLLPFFFPFLHKGFPLLNKKKQQHKRGFHKESTVTPIV